MFQSILNRKLYKIKCGIDLHLVIGSLGVGFVDPSQSKTSVYIWGSAKGSLTGEEVKAGSFHVWLEDDHSNVYDVVDEYLKNLTLINRNEIFGKPKSDLIKIL